LPKNNGLVELSFEAVSSAHWIQVVKAISAHPTLRKLALEFHDNVVITRDEESQKILRTQAVAKMLLLNKQVMEVKFYDSVYDRSTWDNGVAPRLEYNFYRKRFPAIQKVGDTSTRAAILGAAMGRVRRRPSLLYMLLCDNRDTAVSLLPLQTPNENNGTI
jgi:hypothetical protein